MTKAEIEDQWQKIVGPVTFDPHTGEIVDGLGIRMLSVLTPGGHPNQLLGPVVAEALNRPPSEQDQTCGQIVADLAAKAPNCPKHPDTKMTYVDGMEHYHDLKYPHWRCELWIGSGVCGATRPLEEYARPEFRPAGNP